MSRVIHFEIPATAPERASEFYQNVFGWKFDKWGGPMEYWLVTTGPDGKPGINGGMLKKPGPVSVTTNTIDVVSVDTALAAVLKAGGKQMTPKSPIPGIGYFAYCEDTEGNLFGVMEADKNAK